MKLFKTTLYLLCLFNSLSAHEFLDEQEELLQQLPNWNKTKASLQEISGGATNHNFLLTVDDQKYFLRFSAESSFLGNDLEREYLCNLHGSKQGLAPEVILYSPQEKILITDFISSAQKPNVNDPEAFQRIARSIRALHSSIQEIPFDSNPFRVVNDYRENLEDLGVNVAKYISPKIFEQINLIQTAMQPHYRECICHMDLHSGNFLDDGESIWLIDWEYAGMGNPFFDLATFASGEFLKDDRMEELVGAYLEGQYSEVDVAKIYLFRILADLRWGLWSLIQGETSDLELDFDGWARRYFEEAAERASSPKFREYLNSLREGI